MDDCDSTWSEPVQDTAEQDVAYQQYAEMDTDNPGGSQTSMPFLHPDDPANQPVDWSTQPSINAYSQPMADYTGYTTAPGGGLQYTVDGQLLDQYGQLALIGADGNLYDSMGQPIPAGTQLLGGWVDAQGKFFAPNGSPLKVALAADPSQSIYMTQPGVSTPVQPQQPSVQLPGGGELALTGDAVKDEAIWQQATMMQELQEKLAKPWLEQMNQNNGNDQTF